jgi:hypothetical protein
MPAGYVDLGPRGPITGVADTTTLNPGNWSVVFDESVIASNLPLIECYKMIVKGAQGTTFTVYRNNKTWDVGVYGTLNSWDPEQPLIINQGDTIVFAYSDPATDGNPPVVTIWLRYDSTLPQNKAAGG